MTSSPSWESNVKVLRLHNQEHISDFVHLPRLQPNVVVYTMYAMGRWSDRNILFPSLSASHVPPKVVINVPWSCETSYGYIEIFANTQNVVLLFSHINCISRTTGREGDNMTDALSAYVDELFERKGDPDKNRDYLSLNLTMVDPPPHDTLYGSTKQATMEARRSCVMSWLKKQLSLPTYGVSFTSTEIDNILANVKLLSREEYKATISHDQYLLETCARASDCFEVEGCEGRAV